MKEFADWCRDFGWGLSAGQLEQFEKFKRNLLEWNQRMNLTAITDDEGIWQKHFADSLTLLALIPPVVPASSGKKLRMIDVGCGAGFPGLPIKIMRPDIQITMLDSLRKRIFFLEDTVKLLGLEDIECIHARAEDLIKSTAKAKDKSAFDGYDICTARAVARLDKLCGWCLPFLATGGLFFAMKGPQVENEVKEAVPFIRRIGGEVLETRLFEIVPGLVHSVVVVCYNGISRKI